LRRLCIGPRRSRSEFLALTVHDQNQVLTNPHPLIGSFLPPFAVLFNPSDRAAFRLSQRSPEELNNPGNTSRKAIPPAAHLFYPLVFAHFSAAIGRFKHGLTDSKRNRNIITIVREFGRGACILQAFRPLTFRLALLRSFQSRPLPPPPPFPLFSLSLFLPANNASSFLRGRYRFSLFVLLQTLLRPHARLLHFRPLAVSAQHRRIGKHNNPENTAVFPPPRFPRDYRREKVRYRIPPCYVK
jgi:hypothetical protein